jgi:cell wall-associated NlpC family hydrolase
MTESQRARSLGKVLATVLAAVIATTLAPVDVQAHTKDQFRAERRHIKRRAKSQIGAPYRYGGSSPRGFDCSGFTMWVFKGHGARLPHDSGRQFRRGRRDGSRRIWKRKNLRVGDLVFFKTSRSERVGHAGIYLGRHRFISATSSRGVRIYSVYDRYYWGRRWVGATRLPATRT